MLEARSVAVVGASVREGSVGNQSIVELVQGGFDGRIFPVNPKYEEVNGLRAYASLADVGEPSTSRSSRSRTRSWRSSSRRRRRRAPRAR